MTDAPPKSVHIFGQTLQITDPRGVQPVWADTITEVRVLDGVVSIAVGAVVFDGSGPAEVQMQTRLRIPLAMAADLTRAVSGQLDAIAEQTKKGAN